MPRQSNWARRFVRVVRDDTGSASLEFLVGGLCLLVPIVYLIVALGAIQQSALGVEAAARHAARAIALARDTHDADRRVEQVLTQIAQEYGLDESTLDVTLVCRDSPRVCPAAGATLTVTVVARVPLPLVPEVFGASQAAAVAVQGQAVQKTSRLWGAVS